MNTFWAFYILNEILDFVKLVKVMPKIENPLKNELRQRGM